GPYSFSHFLSSFFHCNLRLISKRIYTRRITIFFTKIRQHSIQHLFFYWSCSCVVHVYKLIHIIFLLTFYLIFSISLYSSSISCNVIESTTSFMLSLIFIHTNLVTQFSSFSQSYSSSITQSVGASSPSKVLKM